MKRKWDLASEENQRKCVEAVIARLEELDGSRVGVVAAQDVIDIILQDLAPGIYNAGLKDAKKLILEKFQDLEVDLDILEQK